MFLQEIFNVSKLTRKLQNFNICYVITCVMSHVLYVLFLNTGMPQTKWIVFITDIICEDLKWSLLILMFKKVS